MLFIGSVNARAHTLHRQLYGNAYACECLVDHKKWAIER